MADSDSILYERPAENVARIVLNRAQARNAQDTALLYALNDAFDRAAGDDEVKVVILASTGPHFSAGHDLRETDAVANMDAHRPVGTWGGTHARAAEARYAREMEIYLGFCERWRALSKPTIAQVQGKCIAGGLMLVWPCDLVVASEDAEFLDNTVTMGAVGVEYFVHPWEMGARRAKEHLFTAEPIGAREALSLGMVNRVVPREELAEATLALASRIAQMPMLALKLTKEAVNNAQDAQGRVQSVRMAFALHQLTHSHNEQVFGLPVDPTVMNPDFVRPANKG
ncbi:enoyl-CoA hydratase [uncultured Albimonas sp.]|uniref:enoyl-CoA hydratase n=1 Tax=uncultured Albimonas sp. TaxID=1331701 RepID=UPI0030ECD87A|tara:strand:- start:3490 stop:4341 length:852 start_codon:yes stop_codon:yes gene_type:complete